MNDKTVLESLHREATDMLNGHEMKSLASRDLLILQVRVIEVMLFGEPRTPLRQKHNP
jgi:hypothetical protein